MRQTFQPALFLGKESMNQHQTNHSAHEPQRARAPRRPEQGYALLSILAAMTLTVVIMAAAIPSLKHESQREREEEMFWRGAQIAHAITLYQQTHSQQLPTKLEDLADSFETGGKKKRLLRPSALRDPMTQKGEWVAVRVGDPLIAELYSAYLLAVKQPPITKFTARSIWRCSGRRDRGRRFAKHWSFAAQLGDAIQQIEL